MTHHQVKYEDGEDARNHIVKCTCGWAYSGTWKTVRERGPVHMRVFRDEDKRWNDPRRVTHMPGAYVQF